jgi:hypothetical protein
MNVNETEKEHPEGYPSGCSFYVLNNEKRGVVDRDVYNIASLFKNKRNM